MDNNNLRNEAYRRIKEMIVLGQLKPGERLTEIPLAKLLNISRTPVREAINRLISEGFLEHVPNCGAFVAKFNESDIMELYEIRELLECYSIRNAMQGDTVEFISLLKKNCDDFLTLSKKYSRVLTDREKVIAFMETVANDISFHSLIIKHSGNKYIYKIASGLNIMSNSLIMRRSRKIPDDIGSILYELWEIHSGILDAIISRNPDEAVKRLSTHINNAKNQVSDELKANEGEPSGQDSDLITEVKKIICGMTN